MIERVKAIQCTVYKNNDNYTKTNIFKKSYIKEMIMYITSGEIACKNNLNHENINIMKKRLEILEDAKLYAEENAKLLDRLIGINNEVYFCCVKIQNIHLKLKREINSIAKENSKNIKEICMKFYQDMSILRDDIIIIIEAK